MQLKWKEQYKTKYGLNSIQELKLIYYIQYLAVNQLPVDLSRLNREDLNTLINWQKMGNLWFSPYNPIELSRDMWDWINNILWDVSIININLDEDK